MLVEGKQQLRLQGKQQLRHANEQLRQANSIVETGKQQLRLQGNQYAPAPTRGCLLMTVSRHRRSKLYFSSAACWSSTVAVCTSPGVLVEGKQQLRQANS